MIKEYSQKLFVLEAALSTEFPDLGWRTVVCAFNRSVYVELDVSSRVYATKPCGILKVSIDETIATIREIVDRASQQEARS